MREWPDLQANHDCIFVIDDLLANFMYPADSGKMLERSLFVAREFLASGVKPDKSSIVFTSTLSDLFEAIIVASNFIELDYLKRLHEHSFLGILAPHQRAQLKLNRNPVVSEFIYPQLAMPVLTVFSGAEYFQGGLEISGYVRIMEALCENLARQYKTPLSAPAWLRPKTIYLRGTDGNHMTNENGWLLSAERKQQRHNGSIDQVSDDVLSEWGAALGYREFSDASIISDSANRTALVDRLDAELRIFREYRISSNELLGIVTEGANRVRKMLRTNLDALKEAMAVHAIVDEGL